MIYQYKYSGLEERQVKINEAEALGYMMLHDNFDDLNWRHGDPIIGTPTFTDVIPPSPVLEPPRDLAAEIDEIKAEIEKLKGVKDRT